MEKLEKYKDIIQKEFEYRTNIKQSLPPTMDCRFIMNPNRTEFILLKLGWSKGNYRHYIIFHVSIKDGKVWVNQDNTDIGIADDLVYEGIPKSDIVLGYYEKHIRATTEFAVT